MRVRVCVCVCVCVFVLFLADMQIQMALASLLIIGVFALVNDHQVIIEYGLYARGGSNAPCCDMDRPTPAARAGA